MAQNCSRQASPCVDPVSSVCEAQSVQFVILILPTCLRPCPDLVPVPGHCALALKEMLFRQGAQNHFLAVCIDNNNRFVDHLTTATSNCRGTWVKKHGTDGILCRQVPVPGYGAWILPSEGVPVLRYHAQGFVWAPLKCYVHIGAHAPNPGTKSGRSLKETVLIELEEVIVIFRILGSLKSYIILQTPVWSSDWLVWWEAISWSYRQREVWCCSCGAHLQYG